MKVNIKGRILKSVQLVKWCLRLYTVMHCGYHSFSKFNKLYKLFTVITSLWQMNLKCERGWVYKQYIYIKKTLLGWRIYFIVRKCKEPENHPWEWMWSLLEPFIETKIAWEWNYSATILNEDPLMLLGYL